MEKVFLDRKAAIWALGELQAGSGRVLSSSYITPMGLPLSLRTAETVFKRGLKTLLCRKAFGRHVSSVFIVVSMYRIL